MKHALLLLFLFSLGLAPLSAAGLQDDFNQANRAYAEGRFNEAAGRFEGIIKVYGASPEIFFNMGNAYAQSGDPGRAVLAYERGLRLAPADPELLSNLQMTRKHYGLFEGKEAIWKSVFIQFSANLWSVLLCAGLWIMALAAGVWVWFRRGSTTDLLCLLGSALGTALLLASLVGVIIHKGREDRAVVLRHDTRFMVSPFESAPLITTMKSGEMVRGHEEHGDFIRVENSEGKSGWMRSDAVERVLP